MTERPPYASSPNRRPTHSLDSRCTVQGCPECDHAPRQVSPPKPKTCVCGHAPAHHTKRDSVYAGLMADYRVVWRCAWRGCGCPEFVKAS